MFARCLICHHHHKRSETIAKKISACVISFLIILSYFFFDFALKCVIYLFVLGKLRVRPQIKYFIKCVCVCVCFSIVYRKYLRLSAISVDDDASSSSRARHHHLMQFFFFLSTVLHCVESPLLKNATKRNSQPN